MARNIKHHHEQGATTGEDAQATTGERGGATGAPASVTNDPNTPSRSVAGLTDAIERPEEDPDPPAKARYFRVVSAPNQVMYAGALTPMRVGKVYADHDVDIDLLRRQSVVFEEITQQR